MTRGSGEGAQESPDRISVIVVVYRTGPALLEAIQRVLSEPLAREFVLVDNGSTAEESAWMRNAARDYSHVKLIEGHGNVGFARGCNMGARASSGDILVFLNPDAFLQEGCLRSLAEGVRQGPRPCLVGARVLNPDGTEQRGARRGEVTPVTTLTSLLKLSNRFSVLKRFDIHHETEPAPCGRIQAPTISGAGFAMTRQDFESLGGFDEDYFLHVEDIDLCWRVRKAGGAVWFDPDANVVHLGSTSQTDPLKIEIWKGVGLVRFFAKRADNPRRVLAAHLLAPAILAAALVRGLILKQKRLKAQRAIRASLPPPASVRTSQSPTASAPRASADAARAFAAD
jgi:GT2 family glycosyltransferase